MLAFALPTVGRSFLRHENFGTKEMGNPSKRTHKTWLPIMGHKQTRPKQKDTQNLTANCRPTFLGVPSNRRRKNLPPTLGQKMARTRKQNTQTWLPTVGKKCLEAKAKGNKKTWLPIWKAQVHGHNKIWLPTMGNNFLETPVNKSKFHYELWATRNRRPKWKETQNLAANYGQ